MKLKFFNLLLFGLVFSGMKAQTMYVRPIIGIHSAYELATIKNLTFSNGNLVVTNTNQANGTFALSSLKYLNFTDLVLGTSTQELTKNSFYVYPNPVTDKLYININSATIENLTITLIDVLGKEIYKTKSFNKTLTIDVSFYANGIYFLSIQNENVRTIFNSKIIVD